MAVDHDGKMPFDKVTSTQKRNHEKSRVPGDGPLSVLS